MESLKNMSPLQVSVGLLLVSQLVASVMVTLKHKELMDDGSSTDMGSNAELLKNLMAFMVVSWLLFGLTVMCLVWNLNYRCEMSKNCLAWLSLLTVVVFMAYGVMLKDELPELSNLYFGMGVLAVGPVGFRLKDMSGMSSKVSPTRESSSSRASFACY